MKINKILLGAFALSMTFASCSNDEPAKGPNEGGNTDGEKYVAVSIKNVKDFGSRAATDNGFEGPANGSSEGDITAENIRFYFFTAEGLPFIMAQTGVNGTVIESNMVKPDEIKAGNTNGTATELDAVLVLGTPTEVYKGNRPARMFCLANATDEAAYKDFANIKLEKLLDITRTLPANWSKFRMTNSTYLDAAGNLIYYTDISKNVQDTKKLAEENPADIFIERLAAKIRVTGLDTYTVKKKDATAADGLADLTIKLRTADNTTVETKLDIELQGWQPYMTALRTYAVKNIDESWTDETIFSGWNQPSLHRCYWASDPGLNNNNSDFNNNKYDLYSADYFKLKNFDKAKATENIFYTFENTLSSKTPPTSATDRTTEATAIVVKGVLKKAGATEALDMVQWAGDYFTTSYFKEVVAAAYQDETGDKTVTANDVKFEKYTREGASSNTYYTVVKNNDFIRFNNIQHWNGGITSYFTNIEHLGNKFGVVRNHIYDYEFTNVVGLGVPGNDPKNPDPTKETYLAARVYCLNWHIIGNSVVLE